MVHDPVPSAATARRYRRQFKQIMRQTPDVAIRAELERQWAQNVEQMPGLAISSGRPRENVSGLVLYVLTAVVAQVLDDAAAIDAEKRAAHFERAGDLPRAVYAAASTAPDFDHPGLDRTITARLLEVQRKVVDLRLQPERIRAEIKAGRKRGHVAWVHPDWIRRAAQYRGDQQIIREASGLWDFCGTPGRPCAREPIRLA